MKNLIKESVVFLKKNKKYVIIIFAIVLLILFAFFLINHYKNKNTGNNITNKTLDEVEDYIYNISSYEATIEVTVNSNKNTNKYILKQTRSVQDGVATEVQEVLEPENIKGVKLIYKDNTLQIENTKLALSKIYTDYPYIESNNLWLSSFIDEYKECSNCSIEEDENFLIFSIQTEKTKNFKYKELYFDKKTGKPTQLLIEDNNKNIIIYILYTEIEIY